MEIQQQNIDLLVKKGILDESQVSQAMKDCQRTGMPVEKCLEKLGFISEIEIAQVLADSLGVPFIDLTDYLIDSEVIKLVPENIARKYKIVPLFKIGETLTVAMINSQDIMAIDDVRLKSGCAVIEPVISTKSMIDKVIEQYYGATGTVKEVIDELNKGKIDQKDRPVDAKDLAKMAEEAPVIKLVNLTVMQAIKERASDIHVEPSDDALMIRYRIDGIMHESQRLPKHLQGAFSSRIKVMAQMDIAENRLPQDGRIQLKIENRNLDLRVSTFPTIHGENIVIRILDKSATLLTLSDLGFSKEYLDKFNNLIKRPNGIILVTGPTGSGKTTTIYAALSGINSVEKNIITIEDPVEYEIPLVRQTQVNPKAGLSFANGLRNILRQDPDIIMVGEIRDKETAEIAIQASLTGHLVFSTLHTNDTATALTRLLDMDIEPFLISSSVIGILAQRLVRVICKKCKTKYEPDKDVLGNLKLKDKVELYRGKGCSNCRNTGFEGRIGIFELLVMDEEIRAMIVRKESSNEIKKKAISSGMKTLYEDGVDKVKKGITTVEELLRVTEEG
jgi:type IV pilus assembly protein PilB